MRHLSLTIALTSVFFWVATSVEARVTSVEIVSQTAVLGGKPFGAAGAYERLKGQVHYSVSVADPHDARIVDLSHAVNVRNGEVEFTADFIAVRPVKAERGNGSIILEIPNRGHGRIIALVDGGDWDLARDAGNAWLLRSGFTIVTLGWQWDAAGDDVLLLHAPIAKDGDQRIKGLVRGDLMPSRPMTEIPLGHLIIGTICGSEYSVADPGDTRNVLTVRDSRDAPRQIVPRTQWQFARSQNGKLIPSDHDIHLDSGFQPGKLYEYVYVAADQVVAGLGFAAIRDFASYVKKAPTASIKGERVYGLGISQDGRFLRDFLYQGFNADEHGAMALDGVLAHVAGAGRGSFNQRFAQPSRDAQPTSSVFYPTDLFPFTDLPEKDPESAAEGGLLDRASADHVVPRIFFSNTSYEYWGRAASLIHTSADAGRDVAISPSVRIYHFSGLQHFSGPWPPARGEGDLLGRAPESPLPVRYFWRAMIANMDAWARKGSAPPPSSYPRLADHTLVPLSQYAFPALPGVKAPHDVSLAYRLDFGPDFHDGIASIQPPKVGDPFPVLVPQVDADGNELDGVRLPELTVPLATYTGWNLRDPKIHAPQQRVSFEGSFLPFPPTAVDRIANHDPRKSIAERYGGRDDYLRRYADAVDGLIRQKWILPEDRDALLLQGAKEWDLLRGPGQ